ncbi:cytochrome c3 family protein [Bacillus sp. B-jedd]|uniref:cytochrome c3 family protein n=1 Tax=Bacillus sp. B-jedd TaxID=1476857 RepID=UPI0005156C19|nr:cytochrome c3 family protein [Bacillus sp. B-jedd]CEG29062.1 Doubled CXXCH motif (Paired_CXXCH_1) [Bacillus sp. B-jedd]
MKNNKKITKNCILLLSAFILSLNFELWFPTLKAFSALEDPTTFPAENPFPENNAAENDLSIVQENLPQTELNPSITFAEPTEGSVVTTPFTLSGSFTNGTTDINQLSFTAYNSTNKDIPFPGIKLLGEWDINLNEKKWRFTPNLSNGIYTFTVEIKGIDSNNNALLDQKTINVTLDIKRPYIAKTSLLVPSLPGKEPDKELTSGNVEDQTGIDIKTAIKFKIFSNNSMEIIKGKIEATEKPFIPIILLQNPTSELEQPVNKTGTTTVTSYSQIDGKYVMEIKLEPSTLLFNTTYLAYLDPNLTDDSGNKVFAKFFKFTTKSEYEKKDIPHGHYTANTNMCAACHSTHTTSSLSTTGVSYQSTFSKELERDGSQNYCMACHDGTMNAPVIDKIQSSYQHNNPVNRDKTATNSLKHTDSCTSCHNPHAERTNENPNLLKSNLVYEHKATTKVGPKKVNSLDNPCINCHEDGKIYDTDNDGKADLLASVLSYRKGLTSEGKLTDYALCLRCHNRERVEANKVSTDIEQYYNMQDSKHNFTIPTGTLQEDGSKLSGPFPCAECHETHGSRNIKMLRSQLGNSIVEDSNTFTSSGKTWTPKDERAFCIKCHNGKTEIYGKIGNPIFDEQGLPLNPNNNGHNKSNENVACATCHATQGKPLEEAMLEAAHAPKPGKVPTK